MPAALLAFVREDTATTTTFSCSRVLDLGSFPFRQASRVHQGIDPLRETTLEALIPTKLLFPSGRLYFVYQQNICLKLSAHRVGRHAHSSPSCHRWCVGSLVSNLLRLGVSCIWHIYYIYYKSLPQVSMAKPRQDRNLMPSPLMARSANSGSSAFSNPTKLEVLRLAGPNCWVCNTRDPQFANVIAQTDAQVGNAARSIVCMVSDLKANVF